jgi:hypothetical protein
MKIEFHIDKLMLHGFSKRDAFYIQREVEHSLTRLIENGGLTNLPIAKGELRNIQTPNIHIRTTTRPDATGEKIAKSIYRGLTQSSVKKEK